MRFLPGRITAHVMARPRCQGKTQWQKRIIHCSMEFRRKATFTPTEGF